MPLRSNSGEYIDRFIPNRSTLDFGFTRYMFTGDGGGVERENVGPSSPSKLLYRRRLAESLDMNKTIILAFKKKAPHSFLRRIPKTPVKSLDAPDIINDSSLNLLDWSSNNVVAIALGSIVYLWSASDDSIVADLDFTDHGIGPVTSVKWAPDGRHLAVGLNNSRVHLWQCDASDTRLLRTLQGGHRLRVSSLDWRNDHILTSGGMDGVIINNDVRKRSHIVSTYRGHSREVSCLKWCSSGKQLASGGSDHLLYIWCASMASSKSSNQWLLRLNEHSSAVNALSWCPFQSNLLASGGSIEDPCIKFWKTSTGACLNSTNAGSEVCSLLWSPHGRELLSGHGYSENLLTLWKYPSMVRIAELYGDAGSSRVLSMAKSPDGYNVATVASNERLDIWNVFGTPQVLKRKRGEPLGPFPSVPRIR